MSVCAQRTEGQSWMRVIFGPSDITAWAQEHVQESLSVNTVCCAIQKCKLRLYHAKKPHVNTIQKCRRLLWAKAQLKWSEAKWKTVLWSNESKFEILLETMDAMSCGVKRRGTIQHVISRQFKSLHLWWYGAALVSVVWAAYTSGNAEEYIQSMFESNICRVSFREGLAYFSKTMLNHKLHPSHQEKSPGAELACSPDLSLKENIWSIVKWTIQQQRSRTLARNLH